jgi:pimeloyl-ACP methyl ester carboxylesterase
LKAIDVFARHDVVGLLQALHALVKYRADGWLKSVAVPSAVVRTTSDLLVPPGRQLRLAESIPGCRIFSVRGGHDVCMVHPERFGPVLLAAVSDVADRIERALPTPAASPPMAA